MNSWDNITYNTKILFFFVYLKLVLKKSKPIWVKPKAKWWEVKKSEPWASRNCCLFIWGLCVNAVVDEVFMLRRLPSVASLWVFVWIDFYFLGRCDKSGPKANPTDNNVLIVLGLKISLSELPSCLCVPTGSPSPSPTHWNSCICLRWQPLLAVWVN